MSSFNSLLNEQCKTNTQQIKQINKEKKIINCNFLFRSAIKKNSQTKLH